MTPTIIITIISISTLIALALLLKGLIGYQSSTHTHCKKCKYNLNNLSSPTNCPECGQDITTQNTTQLGLRKKQPKLITSAILLLLTIYIPTTYLATTTKNLNPYKPIWWLHTDLRNPDQNIIDLAAKELYPRIQKNKLNNKQVTQYLSPIQKYADTPNTTSPDTYIKLLLVAADSNLYTSDQIQNQIIPFILKIHKNSTKTFNPLLGEALLIFKHQNLTTKKQWTTFLENTLVYIITIKKTIPHNSKNLPNRLKMEPSKGYITQAQYPSYTSYFTPKIKYQRPIFIVDYEYTKWVINQQKIKFKRRYGTSTLTHPRNSQTHVSSTIVFTSNKTNQNIIVQGNNTSNITLRYTLKTQDGNTFHTFTKTHKNITLGLAPKQPVVKLSSPENLNQKVLNAVHYFGLYPPLPESARPKQGQYQIVINSNPITFSFDAYCKTKDNKLLYIFAFVSEKSNSLSSTTPWLTTNKYKPIAGDIIDIVLVPNLRHAERSVKNIRKIWGKPIIIKNCKVEEKYTTPYFKQNSPEGFNPQFYSLTPEQIKQIQKK